MQDDRSNLNFYAQHEEEKIKCLPALVVEIWLLFCGKHS